MTHKDKGIGGLLAQGGLAAIAGATLVFLGVHSINFFQYIFNEQEQYLAWLGFGLTGGAFLAYLLDLKYLAASRLHKAIAFVMIFLTFGGELATAGFGMQLEAFVRAGYAFTEGDIAAMIWLIRGLAFIHGVALVLHFAGDEMKEAFFPSASDAQSAPTASHSDNGHDRQAAEAVLKDERASAPVKFRE